MRKIISIGLACGLAAASFLLSGLQDLSKYESLKEPRIATMAGQKMLVVEAKGDPNIVGKEAFSLLFKTYFSLPGVAMAVPRARWPNLATSPKTEWVGLYGLPLPDSVTSLPSGAAQVKIEKWEYGEVAEILHIGPYSEETPTVENLHRFIKENGYEIAGPHEEEYLRGPGMAANPVDYWTIIRYQVKRK
ncbi:MAG: GyrI-like domain-containing protein [Acidobacteriota bacterium]